MTKSESRLYDLVAAKVAVAIAIAAQANKPLSLDYVAGMEHTLRFLSQAINH